LERLIKENIIGHKDLSGTRAVNQIALLIWRKPNENALGASLSLLTGFGCLSNPAFDNYMGTKNSKGCNTRPLAMKELKWGGRYITV
jgi:hypothetical protein